MIWILLIIFIFKNFLKCVHLKERTKNAKNVSLNVNLFNLRQLKTSKFTVKFFSKEEYCTPNYYTLIERNFWDKCSREVVFARLDTANISCDYTENK